MVMRSSTRLGRGVGLVGLCLSSLVLSGCVLLFTDGDFQSITFHFRLSQSLQAGQSTLVHTAVQSREVKLKKRWVRVSGRVTPEGGATLPGAVTAVIQLENASGKRLQRIALNLRIGEDGAFVAAKKLKKNLPAGSMILVSVEPEGESLDAGTEVRLCVDVLENKKAAAAEGCAAAPDDGGGNELAVVQVRDNSFDPLRLRIQPNTTVRWVLAGADPTHTVTSNDGSTFDSGFILTSPGDFFEVFFDASTRDRTFEYACITHGPSSQMQGSVQVGDNAPEPNDRY